MGLSSVSDDLFTLPAAVKLGEIISSYARNARAVTWGLAVFLVLFVLVRRLSTPSKGQLPPGPRGVPIFGNLFQLSEEAWLTFTEWKNKYGPLVYITVAGQGMLIMNTHKAAADLLDRRSTTYSDRPRWIVASEILTGGLLVVFTRYGDVWRRMRRAAHEGLHKGVVANFHPVQAMEAILLTDGILREPEQWDNHLRRAAASTIMSVVYDTPVLHSATDPSIARINDFVGRLVRAGAPGAHFVEFFTWMKYLPNWMAKWKRDAEEWYRKDSIMFEGLYNDVQKRITSGDERPSFTASIIRDQQRHGLSERESAWLSATMYAAGAETTSGVLAWFMLAMVIYPEAQKAVQAELDAVVGRSRMPTFADFEHLPVVRATVREALRWRPVDPVGLLHRSTEDDWYEGYFIPKGTICIANVWSLNRDTGVYGKDAEHFNPSRHLDEEGKLAPALVDTKEGHVTFGFGRRICVGRHVANNSLFIDIACLLWAANIAPLKDAQGHPIMPEVEKCVNEGLVVRPIPFKCSVTYRFPEAETILAQTKELHVS